MSLLKIKDFLAVNPLNCESRVSLGREIISLSREKTSNLKAARCTARVAKHCSRLRDHTSEHISKQTKATRRPRFAG